MKEVKTILTKVKETKRTVRYDHPKGEGICPAIYLVKEHIPRRPYPEQVQITIAFPES